MALTRLWIFGGNSCVRMHLALRFLQPVRATCFIFCFSIDCKVRHDNGKYECLRARARAHIIPQKCHMEQSSLTHAEPALECDSLIERTKFEILESFAVNLPIRDCSKEMMKKNNLLVTFDAPGEFSPRSRCLDFEMRVFLCGDMHLYPLNVRRHSNRIPNDEKIHTHASHHCRFIRHGPNLMFCIYVSVYTYIAFDQMKR